LFYFLKINLKL